MASMLAGMSRTATGDGASPTPPPVQLWRITTVSTAAPAASSSGNPAAITTRIRTLRLGVTTGIVGAHPSSTLLTAQRPAPPWSVNRRR